MKRPSEKTVVTYLIPFTFFSEYTCSVPFIEINTNTFFTYSEGPCEEIALVAEDLR